MNLIKRFFIRYFTNRETELIKECRELVDVNENYLNKCTELIEYSKKLENLDVDTTKQRRFLLTRITQIQDNCIEPTSIEISSKLKKIAEIQGRY